MMKPVEPGSGPTPTPSQTPQRLTKSFKVALSRHLHRAKFLAYSLLFVVGATQIIIRERFPEVHPPWPLIAGATTLVLLGVLFVPPLLLIIREKKRTGSK